LKLCPNYSGHRGRNGAQQGVGEQTGVGRIGGNTEIFSFNSLITRLPTGVACCRKALKCITNKKIKAERSKAKGENNNLMRITQRKEMLQRNSFPVTNVKKQR
jgi:hypothetical protein